MEQKRFDKKNLIVLAIVVVLIVTAGVLAALLRKDLEVPADENTKAYLLVEVAGTTYEPILLEEEGRYTITRGEMVNVIAATPDSIYMHSSTCDNQDCVIQGVVSLQNRADRVLQNVIVCLPNEVVLYLYTENEVREMFPMAFSEEDAGNE